MTDKIEELNRLINLCKSEEIKSMLINEIYNLGLKNKETVNNKDNIINYYLFDTGTWHVVKQRWNLPFSYFESCIKAINLKLHKAGIYDLISSVSSNPIPKYYVCDKGSDLIYYEGKLIRLSKLPESPIPEIILKTDSGREIYVEYNNYTKYPFCQKHIDDTVNQIIDESKQNPTSTMR